MAAATKDILKRSERPLANGQARDAGRRDGDPFQCRRFWSLLLAHRVLILLTVSLVFESFPHNANSWNRWYDGAVGGESRRAAFANWDGQHYLVLAEHGYRDVNRQHTAFFPLFPWLLRGARTFMADPYLAGLLTTALGTVVFARYFFLYVQKRLGSENALVGLLLVLAHPAAFYTSMLYTESLFLALLMAWLYFYEEKQWRALLPAVLLPLTRANAFFLLGALVASICWQAVRGKRWPGAFEVLNVAAMLSGMGGYFLFIHVTRGDAWAGLQAQELFVTGNRPANLFNPLHFVEYLFAPTQGWFNCTHAIVDKIAVVATLCGALLVARLRNPLILLIYLALSYPSAAMGYGAGCLRYSLLCMPLFALALVQLLSREQVQRIINYAVPVAVAIQLVLTARFALNLWVA